MKEFDYKIEQNGLGAGRVGDILTGLLLTACDGTLTVDNSVVDSLDLNRYLGETGMRETY